MKTVSWKIKDGREATVVISIDKHTRTIDNGWGGKTEKDGAPATWTIRYSAKVEGIGEVNGNNTSIDDDCPAGYAGQLGPLGFKQPIRDQIEAAIVEVEASDDWKQHLAAEAAADAVDREYYNGKSKIEKAMNM